MKMSSPCSALCCVALALLAFTTGCSTTGPGGWQSTNDWNRKDLDGRYPPGRSRIEILAGLDPTVEKTELIEPFTGDEDGFMRWAVAQIEKETNQRVKRCDVLLVNRGSSPYVDFVFYSASPTRVLRAYTRPADGR